MLSSPVQQLSKENPAEAVWDPDDAEEKAAFPLAQPAKLDRSVGGEGEVGEGAKVDEEVGKEEEEHGWRREDGGVHF